MRGARLPMCTLVSIYFLWALQDASLLHLCWQQLVNWLVGQRNHENMYIHSPEQDVQLLGLLLAGSTGQHIAGRNGLA
jgi:hypothetical protein